MICNNCWNPISSNQEYVECKICNKSIHKECAIENDGYTCDVCLTTKLNDNKGKTIDFEMPKAIRRSYIEVYKTCPFKFYNEVILGHEMPPNIYTELGILTHEMFDKASSDRSYTKDKMISDFKEQFANLDDNLFTEIAPKDRMYNRGMDSIETFYEIISDMPEPYATEETILFGVGKDLPMVQATSDRVNLINGELEVIDWKTGQVMVGKKLSSDLQAPLYIYSIREKYNLPVRKFTFYYLKENKERTYERVTNEDYVCQVGKRKYNINLGDAIKEVQHIFSQIKNGNFNIPIDTRKMYFSCKMCHIREMGLCEGADKQVWKQFNY